MEISESINKLKTAFETLSKQADGSKEYVWFPEALGAKKMTDIGDTFDPSSHNDKWDKIRQGKHRKFSDTMKERRAIAFMASWTRELDAHYSFDPITSMSNKIHCENAKNRMADVDAFTKGSN